MSGHHHHPARPAPPVPGGSGSSSRGRSEHRDREREREREQERERERAPQTIGDYQIVKVLGSGSFGKVKREHILYTVQNHGSIHADNLTPTVAKHKLTGHHVAMKFISKRKIASKEQVAASHTIHCLHLILLPQNVRPGPARDPVPHSALPSPYHQAASLGMLCTRNQQRY